ncbi:MAG: hypothetical protein MUO72_03385 [Bacteroidales bacterium]|nr:hypothetical protein [Bacteroidales bacterium]
MNFTHEPFFEYEFNQGLLKMRSIDADKRYPEYLSYIEKDHGLNDLVITREKLNRQWENYLDDKRFSTARYRFQTATSAGAGTLQAEIISNKNSEPAIPINILVFRIRSLSTGYLIIVLRKTLQCLKK